MSFKNSKERKAYFAKNKDAGWHYKTSHGTISVDTHALPNPDNRLMNKEHTKRDRDNHIKGDYYKGKPYKLVEYASGSPSWTSGIGKLKQYNNRHDVGQRRHSGGQYHGGSIWDSEFDNVMFNGTRPEYLAHKSGKTVDEVRAKAMHKKTNNFKMFEAKE